MSSVTRLILLATFAAVGAGIAICVALSEPPHSVATAKWSAAQAPNPAPQATEPAATTARKRQLIAPSAGAAPPGESPSPPESSSPTWPDAIGRYFIVRPSPLIAIHTWSPADRIELPVPPSPDELPGPSLAQVEVPSPKIEQQVPSAGSSETRQQVRDNLDELRALLDQGNKDAKDAPKSEPVAKPSPSGHDASATAPPPKPKPEITKLGEGDDHLTLDFQDADNGDVLDLISRERNLNILPSNSDKGKVSASFHDVDIQTALAAILKSTGYVTRRHGGMIYVGTPRDFQDLEQALDKVGTRLYQTNYVRAADLQALITPLLTQGVGTVSVTPPSEVGTAADNTMAGGGTFAGGEAVLVRDYETVLAQVDQVVAEIGDRSKSRSRR
jgi:hypothetical protein